MRDKIQSIQILRGLAALLVVFHHVFLDVRAYGSGSYLINFYNLEYFGNIGVDVFFVISGFIMVLIHGNDFLQPNATRTFLLKRFIRVVPLYWLLTGVAAFILFFFPSLFGGGKTFDLSHTIASFLFIPWNNSIGLAIPIIGPGWSLNYEMYFYLIFAFLLFFPKKYFIVLITSYFLLSVTLHFFEPEGLYLQMITNPLLLEFLMGVYIGLLYTNKKLLNHAHWFLVFSVVLILSNILFHYEIEYRVLYFGLPSALLIYTLVSYEYYNGSSGFNNKLILLGTISYSLYIAHVFLYKIAIKIYVKIFGISVLDLMVLFAVIVSIIGAILIYNFIEKPITIYLTNKYIKKDL